MHIPPIAFLELCQQQDSLDFYPIRKLSLSAVCALSENKISRPFVLLVLSKLGYILVAAYHNICQSDLYCRYKRSQMMSTLLGVCIFTSQLSDCGDIRSNCRYGGRGAISYWRYERIRKQYRENEEIRG